jgi:hypothetical protein
MKIQWWNTPNVSFCYQKKNVLKNLRNLRNLRTTKSDLKDVQISPANHFTVIFLTDLSQQILV